MSGSSMSASGSEEDLERELQAEGGRPALARVLTNHRTNRNEGLTTAPRVYGTEREMINRMTVRVDPENEPSFETAIVVVSRITDETAPYGVPPVPPVDAHPGGPVIPVIYDPTDHARIAYDRSAAGEQAVADWLERSRPARPKPGAVRLDITMQMEALSDLREQDELTEAEFEQRKRDLLG